MKYSVFIFLVLCLPGCQNPKNPEANVRWVQLFNGQDIDDWTAKSSTHPSGENYGTTFRVVDGKITVRYDAYKNFDEQFGHLFYKEKYGYYVLGVEYRFVGDQVSGGPGWAIRNSGVMLHSQDPKTMLDNQDFPICVEVQFLGGNGQDARPTANLCTPGTNVVMDGK